MVYLIFSDLTWHDPTHPPTHGWGSLYRCQIFKQNWNISTGSWFIQFLVIWPDSTHTPTHGWGCLNKSFIFKQNLIMSIWSRFLRFLVICVLEKFILVDSQFRSTKQECIPVGWVPSALYRTGCLPEQRTPLHVDRQTPVKTLPSQTSSRVVMTRYTETNKSLENWLQRMLYVYFIFSKK